MATARALTPEAAAAYRAAACWRQEAERRALAARERRAWSLAREAAAALRRHFGASRVVVFGSLVHPGCFTPWSDVDVAAWGLRPDETVRASGMAMDLDAEVAANLVDVGACSASVLNAIEREGVPL